jgi:hypothetical protein
MRKREKYTDGKCSCSCHDERTRVVHKLGFAESTFAAEIFCHCNVRNFDADFGIFC